MLGRLENQKNFIPLLDQMIIRRAELSFKVIIAGEGSLREYIEDRYHSLISSNHLTLLGNIKDIDLFLSNCSIFCFPSLWEGYPNALLEALGCALPIILSSRLRNLDAFVENEKNGYIVSDDSLYKAIDKLLANPTLMAKYSLNSYSRYQKLSSSNPAHLWDNLISKTIR